MSTSLRLWRKLALMVALSVALSGCGSIVLPHQKKRPDFLADYLFKSKKQKARYFKAYEQTLTLFDVDYEEIDVQTRYGPTHVIVAGPKDGQPLVLLHGMDASSTMWYPNIKALSKTHRVYAIDYIMDAGKSVLMTMPLNKRQIALFYSDVFDQLQLKSMDVLGTSRGGWVAAWLAIQPGNKIRRLVLLSPAQVFGMVDLRILPAMWFKMFPSRSSLERTMSTFGTHPEKIHPFYKEQFYIASKYGDSKPQVAKMMPFSAEKLEKLTMPVLFLMGDDDCMNGEKACEKATKYIKNVKIVRVPDSGHFLVTDQPEIVNEEVVKFLN